MHVDYLIIGQGISGTMLSRALMMAGQKVMVVDDGTSNTASKIASGVINPVTGKKYVTTWMAGELLPFAAAAYNHLSEQFGQQFIHQLEVLNFHPTAEHAALFEAREQEDDSYLHFINTPDDYRNQFQFNFGIGAVSPAYMVDVSLLLRHWRGHLTANNGLLGERFILEDCLITADKIVYKNIEAKKLIFCQGAADIDNPYFTRLNFQLNKGEAIIARIPNLKPNHIYKHGPISVVPWQDDLFWIGSNFDREYTDELPTPAFRRLVETTLNNWLKLPYVILDHLAALRPATGGQKPFIGLHPVHPAVGIFNGMGSKGCSLAPYFAAQFTSHLVHGGPLTPDVSIERFARILSR